MKYLITGASGFLGTALTERLLKQGKEVIAIARHESSLLECKKKFPTVEIIIGDIADRWTVKKGLKDVVGVYHLAASKHVGLAERDVMQTIKSNVIGSQIIIEESLKTSEYPNLKFIIGISTDKAAQVKGVYGATKLLMERLFAEAHEINKNCAYNIVRYGNVLESTGSIVPKWRESIKKGEEVVITDSKATRFFWTVDEAVDLIEECLFKSVDATPYVPKMKAMQMGQLLLAMIEKYSDIVPGEYPIKIIGLQPGENAHETMDGKVFSDQVEQFTIEEIKSKI